MRHPNFRVAKRFMSILAYGLNYRTAPLELRERVAFPEDSLGVALRELTHDIPKIQEAAIVSTCNRTELYCAANNDCAADQSIGYLNAVTFI